MSNEFKPIPIYRDCLLRSIRERGGGGEGGGCDCDMTSYLLKEDAERNYQPKGSYATLQSDGKIPYSELPDDIKDGGNCSCDMSKYLDQQYSDVRYLTREDAKTLYQPFGDYSTKEEIKRNVLKYEDVKVPYRDVYQGFQQMMLYIQNKKTGWTYDRDQDFKKNKLEELMSEMFNHYQNNPIITVDEANDKLYFTFNTKKILANSNKPLYGSLIVFDASHPSKGNVSSFAFLWDAGGGKDHFEYWQPQENYFIFGQQILENIKWNDVDIFDIVYNYSGGYRLNLETIRTFIFSDVPDLVPIQRDEINQLENVLNKGKPNGYVPLNERSKIDARFLPENNNSQVTTPTTSEPSINPTLQKCLDEDGVVIDNEEYKSLIISAQDKSRIVSSEVKEISWDGCGSGIFIIQSTHRILRGSVFGYYYYDESNNVHRGYFLFECLSVALGLNNGDGCPYLDSYRIENNKHIYTFSVDNLCSKEGHHDETYIEGDKTFIPENVWCYTDNESELDLIYPINSIVLLEEGYEANIVYSIRGNWEKLCSQTIEGKIINYWKRTN